MKFSDYVLSSLKTESNDFEAIGKRISEERNIRILHATIGITTEIAEIFEMLNKEFDRVNLLEELSDILWYVAILIDELEIDPDEITKNMNFVDAVDTRREIANLAIFSGEILDNYKKSAFYGKILIDKEAAESNIRKIVETISGIAQAQESSLEILFKTNIDKLQKKRYKSGKFNSEEATVRDLDQERKDLEEKLK